MAMAPPSLSLSFKRRLNNDSFKSFFFISSGLAFLTCFSIFFYISSTSKLFDLPKIIPNRTHQNIKPPLQIYSISTTPATKVVSAAALLVSYEQQFNVSVPADVVSDHRTSHVAAFVNSSDCRDHDHHLDQEEVLQETSTSSVPEPAKVVGETSPSSENIQNQGADDGGTIRQKGNEGNSVGNWDVYHDRDLFMQEYKEMNRSLKIFIYPPKPNDPFANLLLPDKNEPGGNYASESYFKKNLFKSHFITNDPSQADLFYLPFSIASLRHDKRIGVGGIQDFVKDYVYNISREYPYWNRTGGADHFYVACHSIGKTAMEKAIQVKTNAIQVVCSSSYFLTGYVSHKDASIPQIWPRKGKPPTRIPSERKKLAFYAGAMNSRERKYLVQVWGKDTEISVHQNRLKTPYSEALLGSKFCLHAKGFEVNTARIGDALYYGCVPVILADYYELPFSDILNWGSFSVVMMSMDIPMLKKILAKQVSSSSSERGYLRLQSNVMEVQKHFQWHQVPKDYDAFHMAMFELWLRRSHSRLVIN